MPAWDTWRYPVATKKNNIQLSPANPFSNNNNNNNDNNNNNLNNNNNNNSNNNKCFGNIPPVSVLNIL